MLIFCVITAVIASFIYTVIKFKIEEWCEESSMNKLSLKRNLLTDENSQKSPDETIEISSDECDISKSDHTIDSDNQPVVPILRKKYDKGTLSIYEATTESDSDTSIGRPVAQSGATLKPASSCFTCNRKTSTINRNTLTLDNSDSSDDFCEKPKNPNSKWYYDNEGNKKIKSLDDDSVANKNISENSPEEVSICHERMIFGIKVKFPVKPYSSQIAVMNKLIQGCAKKENCLLESPTGSGKTLALLCGVLAWHDSFCGLSLSDQDIKNAEVAKEFNSKQAGGDYKLLEGTSYQNNAIGFSDEDDCFGYGDPDDESKRTKIPKIYYGTRTHKQIEQVTRELKKTAYKHKNMTILSSREHSCIQETTRNKTELCNELLDPKKYGGCRYYNEGNKKAISSFVKAKSYGLGPVWDIEDLINIGKKGGLCPYFAARNLMEIADIIFCPYNYILDPSIRQSMQINLKDQVIIFDEAHNIEDICRDVASVNFREDHITAAANECESIANGRPYDKASYEIIQKYLLKLVQFMKAIGVNKIHSTSDDLSSPYWTGEEMLELFNMHNLGESAYTAFCEAGKIAIMDNDKAKEDGRLFLNEDKPKPTISSTTQKIIEHLMFTMQMITSEKYMNDYRACVTETSVKDFLYAAENTWHSVKKYEHRARTLKLLCMNPGVIFSALSQTARCIILASGTLTPTTSFRSELNAEFPHLLNTAHVIPKEQVYATCISQGPTNIPLKANYQNVNSWNFQDELGRVLIDICESVPHGILCFFSSYHAMNTQINRWKSNTTWNKLTDIKRVFMEPRYGGDLTDIMKEYRYVIDETSAGPSGKINGALFLAVFRGKVAEGIDFKDDECRCVVTIGIPYAVRKDPVIDMKIKYNNANGSRGLLNGSDWYSVQAFRALNQALGRCLRHINDWGAVLLVDERFLLPANKLNLPKWVKTMWTDQRGYNIRQNLSHFVGIQKTRQKRNCNI